MTSNIIEEEQIVALLHAKEEKVLAILYEKYSIALFGIIFKILGNKELAEDKLQECYLKIWNYGESYDPKKGRLFTWMMRIARNIAIDTTRSKEYKQRQKIQNLENSVSTIEETNRIELNVDQIGLKDLIQKLNTKYTKIIEVIYFQGYTQAEAAKELDLPLGTVKSRTRKALKLLKEYLT